MKEDKDETGIGSLITLILCGAVLLVAIVRSLNCCIPEASKFDVNIWGNVSEWFTFLVALIGGVFIYKTLDSQMKVQKDQERINKLNAYDIRNKHKANITFTDTYDLKSAGSSGFRSFEFLVEENNALGINIKSNLKITTSHEALYSNSDKFYNTYISAVFKDKKFRIDVDTAELMKFLKYSETLPKENIDFVPFLSLIINYRDNFEFEYSKKFLFSYQRYAGILDVTDSNIDFL